MEKKSKIRKITTSRGRFDFLLNIGIGKEKEYFVENLTMLAASGMDILSALAAVKEGARLKRMRQIIGDLEIQVEDGSPLWRALESSHIFPAHVVSLVRIGEETGKLTENLKAIAIQEQKERTFRSKIRSAMMYPIMVLSLTLIIGVGIAWFILPRLASVFAQLSLDLPLITKILIGIGVFLGTYGLIAVPIFLLIVVAIIYFLFISDKTKFVGQEMLFRLPVVKNLIKEVEIARFGYLLGVLLDAGLPVTGALNSLHQATTFHAYKKLYLHLQERVEEGNSFKKSFLLYHKTNALIPVPVQQMISAGEQSGGLSDTLLKIGETFDNKTETTTKNLTVILEPILLLIIWVGVVTVALAVILPIYSLVGGLNK